MADLTFNTTAGETVARELMIAYLNTGESGTPVWSPIGKRVEDSSEEIGLGRGNQAGHPGPDLYHTEKAHHHTDI